MHAKQHVNQVLSELAAQNKWSTTKALYSTFLLQGHPTDNNVDLDKLFTIAIEQDNNEAIDWLLSVKPNDYTFSSDPGHLVCDLSEKNHWGQLAKLLRIINPNQINTELLDELLRTAFYNSVLSSAQEKEIFKTIILWAARSDAHTRLNFSETESCQQLQLARNAISSGDIEIVDAILTTLPKPLQDDIITVFISLNPHALSKALVEIVALHATHHQRAKIAMKLVELNMTSTLIEARGFVSNREHTLVEIIQQGCEKTINWFVNTHPVDFHPFINESSHQLAILASTKKHPNLCGLYIEILYTQRIVMDLKPEIKCHTREFMQTLLKETPALHFNKPTLTEAQFEHAKALLQDTTSYNILSSFFSTGKYPCLEEHEYVRAPSTAQPKEEPVMLNNGGWGM